MPNTSNIATKFNYSFYRITEKWQKDNFLIHWLLFMGINNVKDDKYFALISFFWVYLLVFLIISVSKKFYNSCKPKVINTTCVHS